MLKNSQVHNHMNLLETKVEDSPLIDFISFGHLWIKANSRSRERNTQEEPRKHSHQKARKPLDSNKKDSGATLMFPLAKAELILASVRIISARD